MRKTRNLKMSLLSLEDRLAPSVTASFSSGNLTVTGDASSNTILVSGSTGAVKVYQVAGDQYAAYQTDPAGFLLANEVPGNQVGGTFAVTGNITVNSGNNDDTVIVTVDSAGLPGNCSISTNKGNDNLIIQARNNDQPNIGRINMSGGDGADNMFIFDMKVNDNITADGLTSGLRPGVNSPLAPGDYFGLYHCVTKTVAGVNTIVAIDDQYGPSVINGNLTVNDPTIFSPSGGPFPGFGQGGFFVNNQPYPPGFTQYGDPGYQGLLVLNADSVVNGNITYAGSGDADGVYIQGTVNGNVTLSGGATSSFGQNDYILSGHVTGFYNATGAKGVDKVAMLDTANVGGPAQYLMNDGANLYDFDHGFKVGSAISAAQTGILVLTVIAGTGDDDLGRISGVVGTNSSIAVNQKYDLGAGTNAVIWNGTYVGSTNGRFDYIGGVNGDTLSVFNNNAFRLFANMGDGDDVINVFVNTKVSFSQLDFGLGNDTFNLNGNPNNPISFWHATNVETINP